MDCLDNLINSYQPKDFIEQWNNPLVTRDFSIYTPLSKNKLIEFFKKYRSDLAFVEVENKSNAYLRHSSNNPINRNLAESNEYNLWGGIINSVKNGKFDDFFHFNSKSEIYTDLPFESLFKMERLNILDKFFLEWKRLRYGLNEEGIPHYLSIYLCCPDGQREYFLLGGINSEGEPIIPVESRFLIDANFFSKEEWFFKINKKFYF
jgi:hypothetical protein